MMLLLKLKQLKITKVWRLSLNHIFSYSWLPLFLNTYGWLFIKHQGILGNYAKDLTTVDPLSFFRWQLLTSID